MNYDRLLLMVLSIKMKNHTLLTKTMTKMAEKSPFGAAYGYIAHIREYPPGANAKKTTSLCVARGGRHWHTLLCFYKGAFPRHVLCFDWYDDNLLAPDLSRRNSRSIPKHTGTSYGGGIPITGDDGDKELAKVMAMYRAADLQQYKLESQLFLLPQLLQAMGQYTSRYDVTGLLDSFSYSRSEMLLISYWVRFAPF